MNVELNLQNRNGLDDCEQIITTPNNAQSGLSLSITTDRSNCSSRLSTGTVIGIVFGAIVGSILIFLLIWFLKKRYDDKWKMKMENVNLKN